MISSLSSAQSASLERGNRDFDNYYTGGFSQLIDDMLNAISAGEVGINSAADDIDALCLGGGEFTYNEDNSVGLTLAYNAGRIHNGYQMVSVNSGTVMLAASTTNYIEIDRSGTIWTNTTGFTSGRAPLMTALTSTTDITTVTNNRCLLTLIGPAGVTGTLLSAAAASKMMEKNMASVSATTEFLFIAPVTGTISGISISNSSAIAASNSNYWTFTAINKGAAGSGTTAVLQTGSGVNSTQSTGGSALTAYSSESLSLSTASGNLNCNKGDTIAVQLTMTGTPTAITELAIQMGFSFTT